MRLSHHVKEEKLIVKITGRWEAGDHEEVDRYLQGLSEPCEILLLNLGQHQELDSGAIAWLLARSQEELAKKRQFGLCGYSPKMLDILDSKGLGSLLWVGGSELENG